MDYLSKYDNSVFGRRIEIWMIWELAISKNDDRFFGVSFLQTTPSFILMQIFINQYSISGQDKKNKHL